MIRMLSIIGLVLLFGSCSNFQDCNDIESKIKEKCVKTDSLYTIPLASLTTFDWDILYVIGGPTVDNEVEDFIGVSYKKVIPDNRRQYIFVKDREIVKEYSSYCNPNLLELPSYTSGTKYLNSSRIRVQKIKRSEHFVYKVKKVQNQVAP